MITSGRVVKVAVVTAILAALATSVWAAQHAPRPNCVSVTKKEYDAARKGRLQQQRFGEYVRSGRVLKRAYWFCPP